MSQAYRHRRNKKYKNHEPYKPWELLLLILVHTVPSPLIILLGTYIVKTQYFLGGSKSGASVEIHGQSAIFLVLD